MNMTSYEALYGKKPNIDNLRVWECHCFAIIPPELHDKCGPRRVECIFVGYHEHRIGWRVCDMNGKYHFSQDVIFNESLAGHLGKKHPPSLNPTHNRICTITGVDYSDSLDLLQDHHAARLQARELATDDDVAVSGSGGGQIRLGKAKGGVRLNGMSGDVELVEVPLRCSSQVPVPWKVFSSLSVACDMILPEPVLANFISLLISSEAAFRPTDSVSLLSLEETILTKHLWLTTFLSSVPLSAQWNLKKEPSSYAEACARLDAAAWWAAMDREISGLKDMDAFLKCNLPPGKKPLTLKWVFAIKTDLDGQIIHGKEKAHVIAQGYCQQPEDFGATAAPVAKLSSVCIVLAWAALQDPEIYQFNCKTAFLHAKLCHDVYCHLSLAGRCLALVVF